MGGKGGGIDLIHHSGGGVGGEMSIRFDREDDPPLSPGGGGTPRPSSNPELGAAVADCGDK